MHGTIENFVERMGLALESDGMTRIAGRILDCCLSARTRLLLG